MLNKERISKMSKMAMFQKGYKKECLKISSYYKKDYIAMQTIMTLLWCTIGYCILAAGYLALELESLLYTISMEIIKEMATMFLGGYFIIIVIFAGIAVFYYGWKYQRALKESRAYYKALGTLSAEYRKGN